MYLNEKLLYRLVHGAAFLGSGGGGKMEAGYIFVREILKFKDTVEMLTFPLSPSDLEKIACIVCDMGSITAFDPKQDEALGFAFDALTGHFKDLGKVEALFPIETGAENTLAAFVLAAKYGIPVIDGDGAGRAVPIVSLCTFAAGRINHWNPVAIANGKGDTMLVSPKKFSKFDAILRETTQMSLFSNSASLAMWPDTLKKIAKKCVEGTISSAMHCGQLLEGIRSNDSSLIAESLPEINRLNGFIIGKGRVVFKTSEESKAFNFTTTKVEQSNGTTITILSQNESLIAFRSDSGHPIALAPHSICYLKSDFEPCTNSEIKSPKNGKNGLEVYIIGIMPNQKLLTKKILQGFKDIINELGFAGKMDVPLQNTTPLGTLFLDLAKDHLPSFDYNNSLSKS